MNDIEKVKKFNYFEKLYFKVTLGIFGTAISLFIFTLASIGQYSSISKLLKNFIISVLLLSAINFFISIYRVIKYTMSISRLENNIGILRSAVSLILSPMSFVILYILVIIIAFSSCAAQ